MVNILVSDMLVLLFPVLLWVIGIVTRIPITVLFAGFCFIAVGTYFLYTDIPNWLSISYGVLGIFVIIGTVYTMK